MDDLMVERLVCWLVALSDHRMAAMMVVQSVDRWVVSLEHN